MNDFIKPFEQLLVFSSSVASQAMTKTYLDISLETKIDPIMGSRCRWDVIWLSGRFLFSEMSRNVTN